MSAHWVIPSLTAFFAGDTPPSNKTAQGHLIGQTPLALPGFISDGHMYRQGRPASTSATTMGLQSSMTHISILPPRQPTAVSVLTNNSSNSFTTTSTSAKTWHHPLTEQPPAASSPACLHQPRQCSETKATLLFYPSTAHCRSPY